MKEGWERKKIKEVADVIGGSTPKTNVEEYWGGNNYWVTPAELDGSKYIEKTVRCITSNAVDKTNLTLMPSGTVLLSSRAPIGKVCITKAPMYCNQGFKNLICKELLYNEFAYYFLKHNVDYLQSLGTGATFKEISKKVVENVTIPVPPLSEQQHIVEELDLLSSIIEKKKAQLNELDNLAQSLFYEMFGDPITNEKGWEVKKMGEVCQSELGKTLNKSKDKGELYPYLCSINILWNNISMSILKQARFEINEIERYSVKKGDLLVCEGGDIGRAAIWDREESMLYQNALHRIRFNKTIIPVFCLFFLLNLKQKGVIDNRYGKGVTIKHLVKSSLLSIPIPIPPISLQQQFASKIEAIEHQKELIKKSIKEVETLFNSRMDYYFN